MTSSEFKAARLTLGLTQVEMARALGYSHKGSISDIERHKARPRAGAVLLLEAYLAGYRPAIWPPVNPHPALATSRLGQVSPSLQRGGSYAQRAEAG